MSFSAEPFLKGLKPFQRDTVEYVYDRYFGSDPVDRFLVADEVGLGKTLVAKGLIAKLIEHHLTHTRERIDVVYVCSNQAIAKQNFGKLAIVGKERKAPDRITTLPLHVHNLNAKVRGLGRGVNIVPITPSTSLDLRSGRGRVDERALLGHLLSDKRLCGSRRRVWAHRLLAEPADPRTYESWRASIHRQPVDRGLTTAFVKAVRADPALRQELALVVDALSDKRKATRLDWIDRGKKLVVDLRQTLAESCIKALEPDLVILDEFQRFAKIIDPEATSGTAELARRLFTYPNCKTLLLSATPYRMYTRAEELSDDHHAEFRKTTRFLLDDDEARAEQLDRAFRDYRDALRVAESGKAPAERARDQVQTELKRVMVRTERLGAAGDRNGMLDASPADGFAPVVRTKDLRAYAEVEQVAKELGARDVVDWWKSAPYLLNMMDDHYQLAQRFTARARSKKRTVLRHSLPEDAPHRPRLDAANPRLRGFLEKLDAEASWRLLWIPASLPYYKPRGPFKNLGPVTKRLVFSRWQVAPKALATLTSSHVERRARSYVSREGTRIADLADLGQPLTWRADGKMTELAFSLPCRELASLCDPLALAQELGAPEPLPTFGELHRKARRRVAGALRMLDLPPSEGRGDQAWYAVAALRLDEVAQPGSVRAWIASGDTDTWLGPHRAMLLQTLSSDGGLGPVPRDLAEVLALRGLASPAVCALRALTRLVPDGDGDAIAVAAGRVGGAFRRMFDLPEAVALVRGAAAARQRFYWRAGLDYCADGNISAVLDEYLHVVQGWVEREGEESELEALTNAVDAAVGITAATLEARHIQPDGRVRRKPIRFRTRFCLRLGDRVDDTKAVQRVDRVRKAFNSPFWPFVLATTSVGQEGLDFHLYSHAVVHWNLPSNPVDLEQREGRVHRFKNHAVRRNLALAHAQAAFVDATRDPWAALFDSVKEEDSGLRPWWIFPGPARIERHVPAEPLSIDRHHETDLVRLLGMYRLAFGQPRQEEFMAALGSGGLGPQELSELALDLAPPGRD